MNKILTGLFRFARRSLMTTDNDMGQFRQKLNELIEQKDTLSDEEITAKVEEIKQIAGDLPDNEGKEKLNRFLEDFKAVKEQDPAVAKKAADAIADQFEKLDTEAMQDVPDVQPEATGEDTPAAEPAPELPPEGKEEVEETVEETEAPEGKPEDEDPNADYSLEEIYQFIKKRMAEDAGQGESEDAAPAKNKADGEANDAECGEEKKEDVVADHAPHIPVTVKDNTGKGSLSELFNMAKRGR